MSCEEADESDYEAGVKNVKNAENTEKKRPHDDPGRQLCEYERMQLERVRENRAFLASIGLVNMEEATPKDRRGKTVNAPAVARMNDTLRLEKKRKRSSMTLPTCSVLTRRSKRILSESIKGSAVDESEVPSVAEPKEDSSILYTADEFFDAKTRASALRVDGHYKGWICPEVMEKFGLDKSAAEAWKNNGDGKFTYKVSAKGKGGESSAKAEARKMFRKNPNQYFYRHVVPGEEEVIGAWSQAEQDTFMAVAKEFGCGDKWGLFSTWIPQRVGYQTSAFYRQELIANGIIFDPNFRFTSSGETVFVGKKTRA